MDQTVEINREFLRRFILRRENRSHKGDYGHALLVCGCDAMPGAASLATGAALKSGCGLVTLHSSAFACQAATIANPSAILSIDTEPCLSYHSFDMSKYKAVGIGPGLGSVEIKMCVKMLMDTDAGTGFIHESFHKDNADNFTRAWFAWQNTLFGELIIKLIDDGKLSLLNSID